MAADIYLRGWQLYVCCLASVTDMDITYESKDMTKTTYIGNAVTRDPIGFLAKIVGLETFLPELRKRDDRFLFVE